MNRVPAFLSLFLCFVAGILPLAAAEPTSLGPPPASHVLDLDHLFRARPEVEKEISERLVKFGEDYGMDVFLVIYTSTIGENVTDLAYAYQKEWLTERNDGLIFLVEGSGHSDGRVGRSRPLYDGEFTERGLQPRIEFHDLQTMIDKVSGDMKSAEGMIPRVRGLTLSMVDQLEAALVIQKQNIPRRDNQTFMGWMALIFLTLGLVLGLISKFLNAREEKVGRSYLLPDLTMNRRLKARNGGGKITCLDFGPDPSADGQ